MLELKDIYKNFGKKEVLQGLSFAVKPGEILGLLAPNGGGKTTTMRIAMGLLSYDSGAATVYGKSVEPGAVRGVGYMPEERGLYPNEKVEDQLRYLARLHKLSKSEIDQQLSELLDTLSIEQYRGSKLKELSLGNKQRVQIAAALIGKPKLLILDEPFSGLDPIAVRFFSKLIRDYAATGAAILFSSHQLDVVEQVATRIGIMKDGRIIFDGELDALKNENQQYKAVIRFKRDASVAQEEISFADCPTVINSTIRDNEAELELSEERISAEELVRSGLQLDEIVEISYEQHSFGEAIATLFDDETEATGAEK